ncbi:MAG: pyridoxine 5'-phosphate synthase [Pseudobacteriovorax sp.]|nr:pyridoxine 5'-phosphate synthase [Pseudobacteriovorax sp.]
MIRLGVNLDHVATIRNARGEPYPNPVQAALCAELGGASNITCHLREDRRHIRDRDVELLKEVITIPLNFEIAATPEMIDFACRLRPHAVTLVPEKREELTTEGGLDPKSYRDLKGIVNKLKGEGMLVSLFVEPDKGVVEQCKEVGAHAIEVHTGDFCHKMDKAHTTREQWQLVKPFIDIARYAHGLDLQVHFGHGLHYNNAFWMQVIPFCEEANIGHAIISRSIFVGLETAVKEMHDLLNDPKFSPVTRGS